MAKDGYVPLDGNAGDLAVGAESVAGAGGGLALDSSPGSSKSCNAVNGILADGNLHFNTPTVAAPPAWLDAAGNIILPGLYLVYTGIARDAAFTASPGLLVAVISALNTQEVFSVDEMIFNGRIQTVDAIALELTDLPYELSTGVKCSVDATGTLSLTINVRRLAH